MNFSRLVTFVLSTTLSIAAAAESSWLLIGLVVVVLSGCFGGGGDPDAPLTFSKSYGGPDHDGLFHAISAAGGGYAAVGHLAGHINLDGWTSGRGGKLLFSRLDEFGDIQWQVAIGDALPSSIANTQLAPASDNGFCLAGDIRDDDRREIYFARLDNVGSIVWEARLDSGEWGGYRYFEGGGNGPNAGSRDRISRIVAGPDGGCFAILASFANLVDFQGIGFDGQGPFDSQAGDIFLGAESTLVAYANGTNDSGWVRRLPEGAFKSQSQTGRFIATTEQGIFVSLTFEDETYSSGLSEAINGEEFANTKTLIAHYGFDGRLLDRAVLDIKPIPTLITGTEINGAFIAHDSRINAVAQTDDPDAGGQRDGVADDGFVIRARNHLIKLDRRMTEQWRRTYGPDAGFQGNPFLFSQTVVDDKLLLFQYEIVAIVDVDDGVVLDVYQEPSGKTYTDVIEVQPGEFRALARNRATGSLDLIDLRGSLDVRGGVRFVSFTEQSRSAVTPPADTNPFYFRHRQDGLYDTSTFDLLDNSGSLIGNAIASRRGDLSGGLAVAEPATGTFWVAGSINSAASSGAFVAAVRDSSVIWQRLVGDNGSGVSDRLAYIAKDGVGGGVVLFVRGTGGYQLIGLAADGSQNWISDLYKDRIDLYRGNSYITPILRNWGNGYVVVGQALDNNTVVRRFDVSGSLIATQTIPLDVRDVRETADGGLILTGYASFADNGAPPDTDDRLLPVLFRLDTNGDRMWYQQYAMRGAAGVQAAAARVQQLNNGDFALAFESEGLLNQGFNAEGQAILLGDRNVTLMRFNSQGEPLWARVHGALYAEGLHSLELTPDGGFIIAGRSDSFGELGESWLLRLGPDGLVSAGCNAFLGEISGTHFTSVSLMNVIAEPAIPEPGQVAPVTTETINLLSRDVDIVVARQCSGRAASADVADISALDTRNLTINQAGSVPGLVTSSPRGIFCGGMDPQFCTLDVAVGNRILLRVDDSSSAQFRGWSSNVCTEEFRNPFGCAIDMDFDVELDVFFEPADGSLVTLSIDVTGGGRILSAQAPGIDCLDDPTASDCVETYPLGQRVDLIMVENPGETFQGWSGDCAEWGTATSLVVVMDRDKICTAQFTGIGAPVRFLLDTAVTLDGVAGSGGEIVSTPVGINCGFTNGVCSATFEAGTVVELATLARPLSNVFLGWSSTDPSSPCSGATMTRVQVTMDQARNCSADFRSANTQVFSLEVGVALNGVIPEGQVTGGFVQSDPPGISCRQIVSSDCSQDYPVGTSVRLNAIADPGFSFNGWTSRTPGSVCETATDPSIEVLMDQTHHCEAQFVGP